MKSSKKQIESRTNGTSTAERKARQKLGWLIGIYLLAVAVVEIYGLSYEPKEDGHCPPSSSSGGVLPAGVEPATLELAETQRTTLRFGRSQDRRERVISYKLSGSPEALGSIPDDKTLALRVSTFLRDDDESLNAGGPNKPLISAIARREGGTATLVLCVDRDGQPADLGPPGSYQGTVTIEDERVNPIDAMFTIALAFPTWPYVIILLALTTPVAAAYAWLLKGLPQKSNELSWTEFSGWILSRTGVLAVSSGLIAAFLAYSATYLQSDTWGTSFTQVSSLLGAMFTAFVTAATAIMAGSNARDTGSVGEGLEGPTKAAEESPTSTLAPD